MGEAWDGTGGVVMAAGHTDSPCLKLRPCSKMPSSAGTLQVGVDTYGGGLKTPVLGGFRLEMNVFRPDFRGFHEFWGFGARVSTGLWHTWFDRPLGVAGKVIVSTDQGMEERLASW